MLRLFVWIFSKICILNICNFKNVKESQRHTLEIGEYIPTLATLVIVLTYLTNETIIGRK